MLSAVSVFLFLFFLGSGGELRIHLDETILYHTPSRLSVPLPNTESISQTTPLTQCCKKMHLIWLIMRYLCNPCSLYHFNASANLLLKLIKYMYNSYIITMSAYYPPMKSEGYSFGVASMYVCLSILTFCLSGTISQYLLVRFDSFVVQMISTIDFQYPIGFVKMDSLTF